MADTSVRVGIDVGGTFTDVAVHDTANRTLNSFKIPSTPPKLAQGVVAALAQLRVLAPDATIRDVIHGTTVATNAVLEGRGATTALITTDGFRDVLEIARQARGILYDTRHDGRPPPLVPRDRRFEVLERLDVHGHVVTPLDTDGLPALVERVRASGAQAVAVCLLHSYRNDEHEQRVKEALSSAFKYISCSAEVNAEYREYERTNTTVINALVMPLVYDYAAHLHRELTELGLTGRLHLVQSNGGMMTTGTTQRRPITTVMSGPAAGVAASRSLLRTLGLSNAVTFDMGGTSTDVCLIWKGEAAVTRERRIGNQPVRVASLNIETIGAGGGSQAWTDPAGALKVGPQSAGADPGPACYGSGGTEATVTDANVVLGYLSPESVWGGRIRIQPDLAMKAIEDMGRRHNLSPLEAAEGIVAIANSNMLRALQLVSLQRGYDLRDFALVSFGGAGPVHAGRLAQELSIPRVVVPVMSGVFSAYGCLVSDMRYDNVQTFFGRLEEMTSIGFAEAFRTLEQQALDELDREGLDCSAVRVQRSLDVRYKGQNFVLELPLEQPPDGFDPQKIRQGFDALHEQLYAYATTQPVECVNLRLAAIIESEAPTLARLLERPEGEALIDRRRAYFRELGEMDLAVFDRDRLAPGEEIEGPAAVEETWSTTIVYPDQRLAVDEYGNLHITAK